MNKADFKKAIEEKQAEIQHMRDTATALNDRAETLGRELREFIEAWLEQEPAGYYEERSSHYVA